MPPYQVPRKFVCCLFFIFTMIPTSLTEQSRTQNIGNSQSLTGNHFEPPKFENVFEAHLAGLRPGSRRAGVHTGGLEPLKNEADWPVIIKRNLMEQTRPEEAVVAPGDKDSDRQREEETLVLRTRSAVIDAETPLELDKFKSPLLRELEPTKGRADGRVVNGRAALLSERRQLVQEAALGVATEDSLTAAAPLASAFASPQRGEEIRLENPPSVSVADMHSTLIDQYSTPLNWTASITGASSAITMDSTASGAVQPLGDGAASTFSSIGSPTTSVPSVTLSSQGVLGPLGESVSAAEIPGSGGALDIAGVSDAEAACSDQGSVMPMNIASSTENYPIFSNCTERLTSECSRVASLPPGSTRYTSEEEGGSRLILAKKGRQAFGIMSKGQFLVNDRDANANVRKFRNKGDSSRMDSNDEESPKDRDQLWENTDINLEFEDSRGKKPLVDELRKDKASEITTQSSPARREEENSKYNPINNVRNLKSSRRIELDPSEGPIQLTLDPRNGSLTIKAEDSEGRNSTGMQVSMNIAGKKTGKIQASLPNSVIEHDKPRNTEQRKVHDGDISRKLVSDEQQTFSIKHINDRYGDEDEVRSRKEVKKKKEEDISGGHKDITELSDDVLEEKPYSQNMLSFALNKGKGEWMDSVRSHQKNRIEPELQGRKNEGIKEMWSEDPVAEVEVNSPNKEGVRIIAPGGQTTVQVKAPQADEDVRKYSTISPRNGEDGEDKRLDVSSIDTDKGQSPDEHTLVVDGIVIKVSGSGRGNADERPLKRTGAASNVNLKSYADTGGRSRNPPRSRENEPGQKSKGTSGKGKEDQFSERRENGGGNRREKVNNSGPNAKRPNKGSKKISHNTARNEDRKKPANIDDSKVGRDDVNDPVGSEEWNRWDDTRSSNDGTDARFSSLKAKDEFKIANGDVRSEKGVREDFTESFPTGNGRYDMKSLKNPRVGVYQPQKNSGFFTGPDSVTLAFKRDVKPGDVVEPVNVHDIPPNSQESVSYPQENVNKPSDTREAAMRLLMKSRGDKDTLAERTKNLLLKLQPSLASNVPGNLDVVEKGLHALKSASGEREYHPVMSASNNDKTIREKQRIFYHRQDVENLVKRADSQSDQELHVSKTHNSQGLGQNVKPQIKEVSQEDSDDLFRKNPLDMMEKKGAVSRTIRSASDEIPVKKRLINRADITIEERRLKPRSPIELPEEEREDWEGVDLNSGNNNYYAERAFPAIVNPEDSFVNTEANILGAPFQRQRSEIDAAQLEIHDVALEDDPPLSPPHVSAAARDTMGDRDSYMEPFEEHRNLLSSDIGPYDSFMGATQVALEAPAAQRPLEAGLGSVLPLPLPFFSVVTMAAARMATANVPLRAVMLPTDHSNIFTMASSVQTPPGQPVPAPVPASVPPPAPIPAFPSTPLATQFSVPESVQPSGWTKLSSTPTCMVQPSQCQPSPEQQPQQLLPPGQPPPPPPPLPPSVIPPPSPPPSVASHVPPGAAQPMVQPTLEQASGVVLSEGQPCVPGQHEDRKADEPRPAPRPLPPPRPVPPNFSFSTPSTTLASTQVSYTPSTFPSRPPPATGINRSRGLAKHTTMDMLPAAAAAVSAAVSLVGLGGGGAEEAPSRGRLAAGAPQSPLREVKKHGRVTGEGEEPSNKSPSTPAEETWRRLNDMLQNEMNTGDLEGNVSDEDRNQEVSPESTVDQESATLRELVNLVSRVTNYANGVRPEENKRERSGVSGGGGASGSGGGTVVGDLGNDDSFLNSWRKSGGDNSGGGGKGGKRKAGKHKTDKRSTFVHSRLISGISPTPEDNPVALSTTDSEYFDDLGNLESSKVHHKLSHGQLRNESVPSESLMVAAAGAGQKTELGDATPAGPGEEKRLHGGGGLTAERSLSARLGKIWHAAHFHRQSSTTSDLLSNMTNRDTNTSSIVSYSGASTDGVASLSTEHWSGDSSALQTHSALAPTESVDTITSVSSTGTPWDVDVTELSALHGRKGRHRSGVTAVRTLSKNPRQETMAVARRKSRRSTNPFVT